MTDQNAAEGPQERPEGGSAGLGPSEPLTGAQAGAGGLDAIPDLDDTDDDWDNPLVPAVLMDAIHQAEAQQKQDAEALAQLPFAGPTVAECAEADRLWWTTQKHGE
ncbi:hypothetical protein [Streptomyces althioticus]|uniref:hypothetical protein n=1 Tax=Streptomyces althioticus TaxID=83380 RepID=UPI0033D378C1